MISWTLPMLIMFAHDILVKLTSIEGQDWLPTHVNPGHGHTWNPGTLFMLILPCYHEHTSNPDHLPLLILAPTHEHFTRQSCDWWYQFWHPMMFRYLQTWSFLTVYDVPWLAKRSIFSPIPERHTQSKMVIWCRYRKIIYWINPVPLLV